MKTFKKAALYVLRGIAFAVYFPFYLLIRLLSLALDRVVSPAVDWLFRKVLFPAVLAFFKYIVAPVVKLFVGPLNWLWRFALRPAFEFGWKWILYPVLKYGIYIPLRFIWRHGLRWFWREIAIPVARYTGIVLAWLLRMIGWLWRYLVYYPLRWGWRHAVGPAIRWASAEVMKPLLKQIRQWFGSK